MNDRSSLHHLREFRYTVTGDDGSTSFVGPAHAIKMFVAGCSKDPRSVRKLLDITRPYDCQFVSSVIHGLSSFDEHNLQEDTAVIEMEILARNSSDLPPFRVYNEATRFVSSQPARLGLIVFNLVAHRIVQVQNAYSEILRRDRGRIRENGEPIRKLYHYQLDESWSLVP